MSIPIELSQKCKYALQAIFELASREGSEPVKVSTIAKSQVIPPRFLEIILSQLRKSGFVISKRGSAGGYLLAIPPEGIWNRRPVSLIIFTGWGSQIESSDVLSEMTQNPLHFRWAGRELSSR